MITHRSSLNVVKHSNLGGHRLVTIQIEVPYYDVLTWVRDIDNGVFDVEIKSFEDDFKDTNSTPWQPEQWITKEGNNLEFQAETQFSMVWEQLGKATAIAAEALKNMQVHPLIIQKSMLPFIGRKVLLTFDTSRKLIKKASLPEPSEREWHLPFITHVDWERNPNAHDWIPVSVFRCSCFGCPDSDDLSFQRDEGLKLINSNSSFIKHIRLNYSGSAFNSPIVGWVGLDELIRNNIQW